ncbi:hypothetical protein AB0J71_47820 [Nonomuraea sp. NPDC049637]|uniref:hypothetical protein n=1 Tax=Nonomuraea sp. NPDC049637 TaxID=3154356 RepID=UPI003417432C
MATFARGRHWGSLLLVLACGLTASCAGRSSTPPPQGEGNVTRALTAADRIRLDQAESVLVQQCMARQQFRYWVPPAPKAVERRPFEVVLDDLIWAKQYGYGGLIRAEENRQARTDPNIAYRRSLDKADLDRYLVALKGGSDRRVVTAKLPTGMTVQHALGGCEAHAKQELYGDGQTWFRLDRFVSNLLPLYMPQVAQDRRYIAALAAWSTCMRKRGHAFRSPAEIRQTLPRLTDGLAPAQAHPVEVKLAVAEASCARESALGTTARSLAASYRAPVEARFADDLATHRALQRTALQRAVELVPDLPSTGG